MKKREAPLHLSTFTAGGHVGGGGEAQAEIDLGPYVHFRPKVRNSFGDEVFLTLDLQLTITNRNS